MPALILQLDDDLYEVLKKRALEKNLTLEDYAANLLKGHAHQQAVHLNHSEEELHALCMKIFDRRDDVYRELSKR